MATITEAIESLSTDPGIRHIVSLSGGKDSTALAIYMRRHYPQLPVEYIFCDTGCELPLLALRPARYSLPADRRVAATPGRAPGPV